VTQIVAVAEENKCDKSQRFSQSGTKSQNKPGITDQKNVCKDYMYMYLHVKARKQFGKTALIWQSMRHKN